MHHALKVKQQTEQEDLIERAARVLNADHGVHSMVNITEEGEVVGEPYYSNDLVYQFQRAKKLQNAYFTPNTFKTRNRRIEAICDLNAFYADLDIYNVEMTKGIALAALNMVLDDQNLPQPTVIIDSGHGLQLFWVIEPVTVNSKRVLKLWNKINKEITNRLQILGADPASTDAARILRVPGTVNKKKGKKHVDVRVIEVDESRIYEMRDFQTEILPELPEKWREKLHEKWHHEYLQREEKRRLKGLSEKQKMASLPKQKRVLYLYNTYTLNMARLNDLKTLIQLRQGNMEAIGSKDSRLIGYSMTLFLAASFIANGGLKLDMHEVLYELNDLFDDPRDKREVEGIIKRIRPIYNYRNQTLIDLLVITDEEQKQLKTIIGKAEKKERKKVKNKLDYNQRPEVKQKRQQKRERNERIVKLHKEGFTNNEIAKQVGVSKRTVINVLNEYRSRQPAQKNEEDPELPF